MQIDWFTVGAQVLNFLVLMWLLKRFLYKPILNAIAAREKKIADQLADAKAKEAAAQKEQDDFTLKNDAFDKQKAVLLSNARKEAVSERAKLMKEAQTEADVLRAKRIEALKTEEQNLSRKIIAQTRKEIFSIAAKALHDLADVSLEERICTVFIKRLHSLEDAEKHTLSAALVSSSPGAFISSAFPLTPAQQKEIKAALGKISGADMDEGKLKFKVMPQLLSGIELSVSGHKLVWSIADYLAALEKSVGETFSEKADAPAQSKPQPSHAA